MKTDFITRMESPAPEDFARLRKAVGWKERSLAAIQAALPNSLCSVCVYRGDTLVGYGRLIGDGGLYCYIQDMMVDPRHQHHGIGRIIMKEIMSYVKGLPHQDMFVGLMAARGAESFYEKLGFASRPTDAPGMYWLGGDDLGCTDQAPASP